MNKKFEGPNAYKQPDIAIKGPQQFDEAKVKALSDAAVNKDFDLEIKTPRELAEAKAKAEVKTHFKALVDALEQAVKTGDKLLIENISRELKKVADGETAPESQQAAESNDDKYSLANEKEIIADVVQEMEGALISDKIDSEKDRIRNRIRFLKENTKLSSKEIIERVANEEEAAIRASKLGRKFYSGEKDLGEKGGVVGPIEELRDTRE